MNHSTDGSGKSILHLTAALLYAAALLRSLVDYRTSPVLFPILEILAVWLALYAGEAILSRRFRWYFPLYLIIQSALAFALLSMQDSADYFAVLFCILSLQLMQRLAPRLGWLCLGLFTLVMIPPLVEMYQLSNGLAFVLIYTAGDVLIGSYSLATRRARMARAQSESLARELQETNQQIEAYSIQREKLAAARIARCGDADGF